MIYYLTYIHSGREVTLEMDANNMSNLAEEVLSEVYSHTGNPDTVFVLRDNAGNTIFTEENFNNDLLWKKM